MFEKSSKRIMFAVTLSSIVFQVVQSVKTGRLIILQFYITYFYHLIRFFIVIYQPPLFERIWVVDCTS